MFLACIFVARCWVTCERWLVCTGESHGIQRSTEPSVWNSSLQN
jgi:hypothetical protein